jgi:hypothetical protein
MLQLATWRSMDDDITRRLVACTVNTLRECGVANLDAAPLTPLPPALRLLALALALLPAVLGGGGGSPSFGKSQSNRSPPLPLDTS